MARIKCVVGLASDFSLLCNACMEYCFKTQPTAASEIGGLWDDLRKGTKPGFFIPGFICLNLAVFERIIFIFIVL